MGKLISIVIILVALATAAVTLVSYMRTPAGPAPNNTTMVEKSMPDQTAPSDPSKDGDTMDKAVTTYQADVRPYFLQAGDVLFGWIGDFYSSNKLHFIDLAWTIFATVLSGLILQRMRTA